MVSRRDFLKTGVWAGSGLMMPIVLGARSADAAALLPGSPVVTKFVDQLPVPGTVSPDPAGALSLTMDSSTHTFHDYFNPATNTRELINAATFGYGGASYLGPTIVAQRGQQIQMKVTNNLGRLGAIRHPMAAWINPSNGIMGMIADDAVYPRAVVHLHGAYTEAASDGEPMDFILTGASKTYNYANDQQAATLWYHDHALSITRLNVYAGLAGFYLLRDEFDTGLPGNPLNLPAPYGIYEIPLVIQDKKFTPDGRYLDYTPGAPTWVPEFFGDVAVVNGKTWPNLNVEPAIYRFRLINGSEARFYNLSLSNGGMIYQIGTDSGLLDAPVPLTSLLLAPGERADFLLDFTGQPAGSKIILQNNARAPYPSGKRATHAGGAPLPDIMQFTVNVALGTGGAPVTVLPASLRGAAPRPALITPLKNFTAGTSNKVKKIRNLVLFEVMDPITGMPVLDTLNILRFDESESGPNGIANANAVAANTLEQWNIINLTADVHPAHLHLVQFQLLNRQSINTTQYMKAMNALGFRMISALNTSVMVPDTLTKPIPDPTPFMTGPAFLPAANELGWKDTIQCPPGQVTSILVPFGNNAIGLGNDAIPFGRTTTHAGKYVWHCHILDHEENDMMNFYNVV